MKILKSILLLVVLILFGTYILSCNNDLITNNNGNSPQFLITSLGGNVNSLPSDSRHLKAVIIQKTITFIAGEDSVGTDNMFLMNLSTPPDSSLINMSDVFYSLGLGFEGGISYSDTSAKGNYLPILAFNDSTGFDDGVLISSNYAPNGKLKIGDFFSGTIYIDRNDIVTGSSVDIKVSDTTINNINLNLGKGYNRVTHRIKTIRDNFLEFDIFSGDPDGAVWYYNSFH